MPVPFRLQVGEPAPMQQSGTTCGAACLSVSRMLVDPAFSRWIVDGIGKEARERDVRDGRTPIERFAAYEQVVAARTNAMIGSGGRWQLPWPRALGTPPWGAINELEYGAADPEADYNLQWIRFARGAALERVYAALRANVRPGSPALLYIGNGWSPRHVVLVLLSHEGADLDVYEPSVGRVLALPREAFVTRRLRLAGWDVPWGVVWDGLAR